MRNFIALLIALFLIIGNGAAKQTNRALLNQDKNDKLSPLKSDKVVRGQLGKEVDNYLNRIVPFGFSGAILVAKNDEIILQNGYGLANRVRRQSIEPDTVSYIGSLTKQFTAAAIIKLEMQGKLRVTDTLDKHFKDVPADKAGITIHQLLTHSSGLGSADDIYGSPIQKDEQIVRVMAMKLRSEPGKQYFYSNPGYNLLGIIVENVSGQPYERYIHENLFKPAGMLKTGYRIPKWEKDKVAHGYSDDMDKGSPLDRPWLADGPSWAIRGAGGMLSTVSDLYRWHLSLKKDDILSAEAKSKIFSPHVKDGPNFFYGYGWSLEKTPRGTNLIAHNGGDGIFFADFRRYIDENTVIIGLSNDTYGTRVIESKVPSIVFGEKVQLPPLTSSKKISHRDLQKYVGSYRLPSGATVGVMLKGNGLVLDPIGQEAVNLLADIQPAQVANLEKLTVKTKEILDGAANGDFTMLKAAAAPTRFDNNKTYLMRLLELSEGKKNSSVNYTVLGAHPLWIFPGQPIGTFVRMSGKEGPIVFIIAWERDLIINRGTTTESEGATFRTPFVAGTQKNFVGFHAGLEKPISIRFKTNQKGEVIALEFQTAQGIRTAKRADMP